MLCGVEDGGGARGIAELLQTQAALSWPVRRIFSCNFFISDAFPVCFIFPFVLFSFLPHIFVPQNRISHQSKTSHGNWRTAYLW